MPVKSEAQNSTQQVEWLDLEYTSRRPSRKDDDYDEEAEGVEEQIEEDGNDGENAIASGREKAMEEGWKKGRNDNEGWKESTGLSVGLLFLFDFVFAR
jgi:flagellar biosynthesis/type III secretory pathway protein FliH